MVNQFTQLQREIKDEWGKSYFVAIIIVENSQKEKHDGGLPNHNAHCDWPRLQVRQVFISQIDASWLASNHMGKLILKLLERWYFQMITDDFIQPELVIRFPGIIVFFYDKDYKSHFVINPKISNLSYALFYIPLCLLSRSFWLFERRWNFPTASEYSWKSKGVSREFFVILL